MDSRIPAERIIYLLQATLPFPMSLGFTCNLFDNSYVLIEVAKVHHLVSLLRCTHIVSWLITGKYFFRKLGLLAKYKLCGMAELWYRRMDSLKRCV